MVFMKQKKQDLNIFARAEAERRRENLRNSYLYRMLSRIGTSIAVISHGKLAVNNYMALAIQGGIDVQNAKACIVVNIGNQTTDIIAISQGRILSQYSIAIGQESFLVDMLIYMGRMHNLRIDKPIAKKILAAVGAAYPELSDAPEEYMVVGSNRVTDVPMRVPISYQEVSHCLHHDVDKLGHFIQRIYESLRPEYRAQIQRRGIFFIGEGANLRGLATRMEIMLNIPCYS